MGSKERWGIILTLFNEKLEILLRFRKTFPVNRKIIDQHGSFQAYIERMESVLQKIQSARCVV